MADTVTTQSSTLATIPASTVIATDDAGASGHVQLMKLAISTDGSATLIPAEATNGLDVDVTRFPKSATATLANVSGSVSSVTLIAANTSRVGAYIWNDSTAVLYVKFGSSASATSATFPLNAQQIWEAPTLAYTGIITGVWASATGAARVTELT